MMSLAVAQQERETISAALDAAKRDMLILAADLMHAGIHEDPAEMTGKSGIDKVLAQMTVKMGNIREMQRDLHAALNAVCDAAQMERTAQTRWPWR